MAIVGPERECIDQRTIASAQRGEVDAVRVLFDALSDRVYRYARSRGLSHEASQDIVQESFVRLIAKFDGYVEGGQFEGWFFCIVRNLMADEGRRLRQRGNPVGTEILENEVEREGPGVWAELGVSRGDLERAVRGLDDADQEAIHLRFAARLQIPQMATVLGEKPNTVLARIHRALKKLRVELGVEPREGGGG